MERAGQFRDGYGVFCLGACLGDSFKIIQRGDADLMICGGAEASITPWELAALRR